MSWRWPSQNTFGMWTVLYWTRSSRTQFGVSINVWRLAGDTLNITCKFLYCNHQVHRDFWSSCTCSTTLSRTDLIPGSTDRRSADWIAVWIRKRLHVTAFQQRFSVLFCCVVFRCVVFRRVVLCSFVLCSVALCCSVIVLCSVVICSVVLFCCVVLLRCVVLCSVLSTHSW
jgi:hypothetical protein